MYFRLFNFFLIYDHFVHVGDVMHKYLDVMLWSFGYSNALYVRLKPPLKILLLTARLMCIFFPP